MWDIKSVTDSKYSCEQALMKAYALYLSRDYQMILADSWGFKYNYKCNTIGEKISPGYRGSRNRNYEFFHGIKITNVDIPSLEELNVYLNDNLHITPVMIDYDTYYCPWSKLYEKRHIFHRLLIIDVFSNGDYLCLDHYMQEAMRLNVYNDWKGNISLFINEPFDNIQIEHSDYIYQLQIQGQFLIENNMLGNLKNFLENMRSLTELSRETDPYESLDESPLLININRVKNQRLCFKEYLEYLLNINILKNHHLDYINLFDTISTKYHSLKMSIAKEIMQKKPYDRNKILQEIYSLENLALEGLITICKEEGAPI